MHLLEILTLLGCALIAAKLLGGIFEKIGIPSVLAELSIGVILGNVGWHFAALEQSEVVKALAEMGALFLLFVVGLETEIKKITQVGTNALLAALAGVIVPFALAFLVLPYLGGESGFNHTLFMAAALTATSVGITARVLKDIGLLNSTSGQIILGAAVIDDVLGIIILSLVSALVTKGDVSAVQIASLTGKIIAFGFGVLLFRKIFLNRALPAIKPLEVSGTVTVFLVSMVMIAAWLSEVAGLKGGILGAFALGVALEEVHFKDFKERSSGISLEKLVQPLTDFLVPIFFIVMGMGVKLTELFQPDALIYAAVLIVLAILGKLACGLPITKKALAKGADRMLIGIGMLPRGEVGLIFALMGKNLGILNSVDYSAVIMMVAVTTFLAPGLLSWRGRKVSTH